MAQMCYYLFVTEFMQRVRQLDDSELDLEKTQKNYLDICTGNPDHSEGLRIADGSHGVVFHTVDGDNEKTHGVVFHTVDGDNEKTHGVCMPSPCALGCSFDRELVREVGRAVGSLAIEGGYGALLSPDAGVVRSPLYGSLADRFGEDPYLCGTLAAEWVSGVQSEGVAAVLDNFAGSNQSTGKFTCDSMIDSRALHEIYLKPFETAVRLSKPKGVRCGFNKINGLACCENHVLLTDILKRQWHFEGAVLADMRTADPVEAMACGVDLSYPPGGYSVRRRLKKALRDELLPRHYPKAAAARVQNASEFPVSDFSEPLREEECHELTVKAAESSAVLLKNHRGTLPLPLGGSIALIGRQARELRFQRGGIKALAGVRARNMLNVFDDNQIRYKFCEGYGENSAHDSALLAEAVQCASESEFAVIFVGFDDVYDNAASDRFTNQLPKSQTKLISAVAKVNPNTVIVAGGSALPKMNWIGRVKAVLYLPLGGEGTADALYRLLFGMTNPCGRLPVTYSLNEADMPCGDTFGQDAELSQYRESIYVGYRYFNKAGIFAALPFGYGLSYTEFEYSRMRVNSCAEGWEVTVDVKNVGMRDGAEIVQFYIEPPKGDKFRPARELKQFRKVFLPKGEKRTVSVVIPHGAFEYYSEAFGKWRTAGGRYRIWAAASSVDLRTEVWVTVKGEHVERYAVPQWYKKPTGRPSGSDFLSIFGEATTKKALPGEQVYSTENTLHQLYPIGLFKPAVKLIRLLADKIIRADSRREPAYAERIDLVLNMPVSRLSGLCRGFYPMRLTRLMIAIANRRGRKRR